MEMLQQCMYATSSLIKRIGKASVLSSIPCFYCLLLLIASCKSGKEAVVEAPENKPAISTLSCAAPYEQSDYSIYTLSEDAVKIGDVMPYFDSSTGFFNVYYLKDIWSDVVNRRHPWYCLKTNNFTSYSPLAGEVLSCSSNPCSQDFAIGTGSIIKSNSTYYAFYTGHNPNYPSSCTATREGVMLATSTSLNSAFAKNTSFSTLYAPVNLGYDQNDNFRDPYVFYDDLSAKYYLILAARKNVNGTWRGVIPYYTSSDLLNWSYQGVLYDGGLQNFFMMETPEIFKMGDTYYLLFSDYDSKNIYYRKSTSLTANWNKPDGLDRFEGKGIYAAKTAADDNGNRYIFGWTYIQDGNSDTGTPKWGGNLVVHKLYAKANGDLAVTIPPTVEASLETQNYSITKNSQRGNVINTVAGSHSYTVSSSASFDIANVIFEPINLERYKISAQVSYTSAAKDFGFMIGACDATDQFYSLRFIPSQNRFSLDKINRSQITSSTVAATDVPLTLTPNATYDVQIVIENSMLVVYINNEIALSTRVYKATNTSWGVFSDNSSASFNNIKVTKP